MSIVLLIFGFLLITYLIATALTFILSEEKNNLLAIFFSFLTLVISSGLSQYLGINILISTFLVLLPVFVMIIIKVKKNGKLPNLHILKLSRDSALFMIVAILLMFLFALPNNFQQKNFVNPDPFGYAAVTGSVERFGDFFSLLDQYDDFVGVPFEWDANWDNPQEFSLLDSPWHIPDATIKYGIGNGFYLHNGFSFLIGDLISIRGIHEIETFLVLWNFFTILSAAFIVLLIFSLGKTIYQNLRKNDQERNATRSSLLVDIFTLFALLILILNSRWMSVYLIEGFGNQLLSYAICIGAILAVAKLFVGKGENFAPHIFIQIIAALAQFFVYAQQLVFQIFSLVVIVGVAVLFKVKRSSQSPLIKLRNLLAFSFSAFLTGFFLLQIPIVDTALRALTNSGGGGATHLGVLSPLRSLGISQLDLGDIYKVRNEVQENLFVESFWPNSGPDGTGYILRGQGYELDLNSSSVVFFQLFILILLIMLVFLFTRGRSNIFRWIIVFQTLPLLIIPLYYLFTRTGSYLKIAPNNSFNDYIWMRILAYNAVIIWAFIAAGFYYFLDSQLHRKKSASRFGLRLDKRIFVLPLVISVIFSIAIKENLRLVDDVTFYSETSEVSKDCEPYFPKGEIVFVASDTVFPELIASVCGSDLRLLSDSFSVIHKADSKVHKVIQVQRNGKDKWNIQPLFEFLHDRDISTPCKLECINGLNILKELER